eukprot:8568457-Pyramimonas_sp.AAC.1
MMMMMLMLMMMMMRRRSRRRRRRRRRSRRGATRRARGFSNASQSLLRRPGKLRPPRPRLEVVVIALLADAGTDLHQQVRGKGGGWERRGAPKEKGEGEEEEDKE